VIEKVAGKYESRVQTMYGDLAAEKLINDCIDKAIDDLRKRP